MKQRIAHFALVVKDYDDAIAFYTQKLHFQLLEDTTLSETKRWVRIAPPGSEECGILLAKAANDQQSASIGNQTGGRVFLFLHTDNIDRDLENLKRQDIQIIRPLENQPWGRVLVFADLYGNLWDLIEPNENYLKN